MKISQLRVLCFSTGLQICYKGRLAFQAFLYHQKDFVTVGTFISNNYHLKAMQSYVLVIMQDTRFSIQLYKSHFCNEVGVKTISGMSFKL